MIAKSKASITVFLSIIFVLMISFVLVLLEGARITMTDYYQKQSIMLASEALLADYNIPLFEYYDLFGIDGNGRSIQKDFESYVLLNQQKGIFSSETDNMYISELESLTESNFKYLNKEIKEYMSETKWIQAAEALKKKLDAQKTKSPENAKDVMENAMGDTMETGESSDSNGEENTQNSNASKVKDPRKILGDILKNGVLSIILPKNFEISNKQIKAGAKYDSGGLEIIKFNQIDVWKKQFDNDAYTYTFKEKMDMDTAIQTMYMLQHFKSAIKQDKQGENVSTKDSFKTGLDYEMEYMIGGYKTDKDNLSFVVNRLIFLRMLFNFSHIMANQQKLAWSHSLAATLGSVILLPELEPVIHVLIVAAWAYAEGIVDVRHLLEGKKVSLLKNASEWQLSAEGFANMSKDTIQNVNGKNNNNGLSYNEYLSLLLLMTSKKDKMSRMSHLIEENIRLVEGYSHFKLSDCYYGFTSIGIFTSKPVFFTLTGNKFYSTNHIQWSRHY